MKKPLVAVVRAEDHSDPTQVQKATNRIIELLGGLRVLINPGDKVLIKPNLVEARSYQTGTTTNPWLIRAIIRAVKAALAGKVIVGEGSTVGTDTTEIGNKLGIDRLCIEEGAEFIDLKRSTYVYVFNGAARAIRRIRIPQVVAEANVIINLPVMKTHDCLPVTLGLKNMKGVIHETDKKRFHRWGLEECIIDLNRLLLPELTIIDGTVGMEGLGPVNGNPVNLGVLVGSFDTVAADVVAAYIMGFELDEIDYIRKAGEDGLGCYDQSKMIIVGESPQNLRRPFKRVSLGLQEYLSKDMRVIESGACSGCRHCFEWLITNLERRQMLHKLHGYTIVLGQTASMPQDSSHIIRFGQCTRHLSDSGIFIHGCPPHLMDIEEFLKSI